MTLLLMPFNNGGITKPLHLKEKLQESAKHHTLSLSSIVASEILYGARKKNSDKLSRLVNAFIDRFVILDYDRAAALEYADIRATLEARGEIIGSFDLLIAAHVRRQNAILVTQNSREFKRVPSLLIEEWA